MTTPSRRDDLLTAARMAISALEQAEQAEQGGLLPGVREQATAFAARMIAWAYELNEGDE